MRDGPWPPLFFCLCLALGVVQRRRGRDRVLDLGSALVLPVRQVVYFFDFVFSFFF